MKLAGARIEAFVRKPDPAVVAVLLYGPDHGLVRERADRLVVAVAGARADPFRVSELSAEQCRDDPGRLVEEAASLPFSGGRRVVRVREAKDSLAEQVRALLAATGIEGLVIVESGELGPRAPLRQTFEVAANAAALPCYSDEGDALRALIVAELTADGMRVDGEAAELLTALLGADRGLTRSELQKLVLYKGEPGEISSDDVLAVIGDARTQSADAVAYAACGGDFAALDGALAAVSAEGLSAIPILRTAARHLQRLLQARVAISSGATPAQAVAALKPPVFFRLRTAFERQAATWTGARLAEGLLLVTDAELDCKRTGAPQQIICHRALIRLGQIGAAVAPSPAARRGR